MSLDKERIIPILAVIVIIIGIGSTVYVNAIQSKSGEEITIGDEVFEFEYLFLNCQQRDFTEINSSGIALDDIIIKSGVSSPDNHDYTIIGTDAYQKTVTWEDMKNGLLSEDKQVIFPDLPLAFHVRDVIKIMIL